MRSIFSEKISDKVACVMIEGVGLVFGKMNKDATIIKNPRVIQTQNIPNQPPKMRLASMIGDPDELILVRSPVFGYKILNKELKDNYIKETTGLVIADKIPNMPEGIK